MDVLPSSVTQTQAAILSLQNIETYLNEPDALTAQRQSDLRADPDSTSEAITPGINSIIGWPQSPLVSPTSFTTQDTADRFELTAFSLKFPANAVSIISG